MSTMSNTNTSTVIAVGVAMPILGIAAVGLRFYTRQMLRLRLLIDDWLLVPALLLTVGMGACLVAGEQDGLLRRPDPDRKL